jgi:Tripartite tricarboxylate transporter family receptor
MRGSGAAFISAARMWMEPRSAARSARSSCVNSPIGELFKRMTGIEMTHVPYRSGAQQDLIAGHVDVMFAVAPFDLLRAGLARGIAVTTASGSQQHRNCRRSRNPACRASTWPHGGDCFCPPRLRLPLSQSFMPIRSPSSPNQRSKKRCRLSVRYPSVPRLRSSPDISGLKWPSGGRSFAMPTFASTVEAASGVVER